MKGNNFLLSIVRDRNPSRIPLKKVLILLIRERIKTIIVVTIITRETITSILSFIELRKSFSKKEFKMTLY
tara:strand:+ start:278 stop:490 length:213 start_codon:yes stop_codon:yes gene_type:complete